MGNGGKRESLIQDEKGKWMYISSMQNLMKKQTKKKEQKNPTNSMTSFKGFGRARTSYQKTVIRDFFKKNKKQKADGQDGIQQ